MISVQLIASSEDRIRQLCMLTEYRGDCNPINGKVHLDDSDL